MGYYKGVGGLVSRFCEEWVVQTKGRWAGKPLILEPWERALLDELYLVDDNGNNVYREALVGIPRKNGKSTLTAAIALYGLLAAGEQGAEVYCAAGSKDQARIVFKQAADFVEASPRLRQWLTPMKNVIVCESTGGIFRVLSADAPLQHGLNPSVVIIDELWVHEDPELYYALTTGQLARENPLVVTITTAGWDRDSICWEVYERGRELERQDKPLKAMREQKFLFKWFSAPEGMSHLDPEAWALANPSSWIKPEILALEAIRLPENVFRRLHLNQWTETEDAWISADLWDACIAAKLGFDEPIYVAEQDTMMAVDVGFKKDSAALVWGQWHDHETRVDKDGKPVRILHIGQRLLLPEEIDKLGITDTREAVGQLNGELQLREVPYDTWSFQESAEMLEERGVPMVEFPQNHARMVPASEQTYELIADERLVHDGNREARRQVLATATQQTERGVRISKRKSKERIDFTVALAMLVNRMIEWEKGPSREAAFV